MARRLSDLSVAQHRVTRLEAAKATAAEALALALIRPIAHTGPRYRNLLHGVLVRFGDLEGSVDRPSLENPQAAVALYEESIEAVRPLMEADSHDLSSQTLAALARNKLAWTLASIEPRRALLEAKIAVAVLDKAAPNSTVDFRATPRLAAARAALSLKQFGEAEGWLRDTTQLLTTPGTNSEADLNLLWALLELARHNRAGAEDWFGKAIAAQEVLYKRVPTPSYAWNLAMALEQGAMEVPANPESLRQRLKAVWSEQNRKFPGQPYIEKRSAAASL